MGGYCVVFYLGGGVFARVVEGCVDGGKEIFWEERGASDLR